MKTAYTTHKTLLTKSEEHGHTTSGASAPNIQAMMLEQARLCPGLRVLEIESGGYTRR